MQKIKMLILAVMLRSAGNGVLLPFKFGLVLRPLRVHRIPIPRLAFLLMLVCPVVYPASIDLGVLSFNTLIPSTSNAPGVNDFAIDNFTGTSALPPDFPADNAVSFLSSSLVLHFQDGSEMAVSLGNFTPGSYTPSSLQFSASDKFTSALFTATLNPTTFTLNGGSIFHSATSQISVDLIPPSGSVLSPGTDFASITAFNTQATPEPCSAALVLLAFAVTMSFKHVHKNSN